MRRALSKSRYFCVRSPQGYLALGPTGGPYTVWVEHWQRALKFKTEEELREWCAINRVRSGDIVARQS